MINIISSELYRIFHKKTNYMFFITLFLLFTFFIATSVVLDSQPQSVSPYLFRQALYASLQTGIILVSINSFLAVYCDDISSGYIKHIISKSSNRASYVMAKFITLLIYAFLSYLLLGTIFFAEMYIFSKGFYSDITPYMPYIKSAVPMAFVSYIGAVLYAAFGSVVLYFSSRVEISIIWTVVSSTSLIYQIFSLLAFLIKPLKMFLPYSITALLNEAANTVTVDAKFISFISLYVALAILLQIILLNIKELKLN